MMDADALARFRKICGLLGSAHDGERATAASMASDLLRQHDIDWSKIGPVSAGSGTMGETQAAIREWQRGRLALEEAKTVEAMRQLDAAHNQLRVLRGELARGKADLSRTQGELEQTKRAAEPASFVQRMRRSNREKAALKAKVEAAVQSANEAKRMAALASEVAEALQQELSG